MLQFVTDRGGRCTPGVLVLPVAVALLLLGATGTAASQTAPASPTPAPTPTAQAALAQNAQTAPTPPQTAPTAPQTAPQNPPQTEPTPPETAPKVPGDRQGRGPRGPRGAPPAPGQEPADLEGVMDGIKGQLKSLAGAIGTSNTEAALVAVNDMERLVLLAKKYGPNNMNTVAAADRPAHQVAYRKALLGVLKELADVELNVLDGKFDAAMEQLKGPLAEMRDDAHDKFQAAH